MWILKYSKNCLNISDEDAAAVIKQLIESGKDDLVILEDKVVFPIKKFESLEKLSDEASEYFERQNEPPMPTSEQDGKSTHNGVEIPDDLKRPKVPKA